MVLSLPVQIAIGTNLDRIPYFLQFLSALVFLQHGAAQLRGIRQADECGYQDKNVWQSVQSCLKP